jgi:chromosomal replication initiator protein
VENGVFTIPLSANLAIAEAAAPHADPAGESALATKRGRSVAAANDTKSPAILPFATTLDFIAGPENRLAAVAIESLLQERPSHYNPLVLLGAPGTGKSHLARGLSDCWATRHSLPPASVVYFAAADFANDLKAAIEDEATQRFRERVREASLLVIENLSQLQTRHVAQQELIHSLDAVVNQGGQVVVTSHTSPERIANFSPDLCSRLAAGLTVPLTAPAAATRLAIVERLAELRSIPITAPAARVLADGLNGIAPELLGALLQLDVQSQLTLDSAAASSDSNNEIGARTIDNRAVRQWLADRRLRLQPSLRTIANLAAKYFGLRVAELISPSRRRAVVQARAIAMYLGRQLTAKSLEQLGKHFGGRDHTTVLHSYRSIEARLQSDPTTRRAVADIRKALAHA